MNEYLVVLLFCLALGVSTLLFISYSQIPNWLVVADALIHKNITEPTACKIVGSAYGGI
jgi:hypothetical protein